MTAELLNEYRPPKQLVENRVSFAGASSEVSIYDTYEFAERVKFDTKELLFCGMLSGRKTMYLDGAEHGEVFLPHESFIVAPGKAIEIDFPEARLDKPTTCLTVEISKDKLTRISNRLSEDLSGIELDLASQYGRPILHTHHCTQTQGLLKRVTTLFMENHPDRNTLIDLNISELIVRLLRHKTRNFLLAHANQNPEQNGLIAALDLINKTLSTQLDIDALCKHAGMSRSRLYTEFKDKLGCSPLELQQQLRLKSAADRLQRGEAVTVISYDLGFNSPSHFCHRFKDHFGCTATQYRKKTVPLNGH